MQLLYLNEKNRYYKKIKIERKIILSTIGGYDNDDTVKSIDFSSIHKSVCYSMTKHDKHHSLSKRYLFFTTNAYQFHFASYFI